MIIRASNVHHICTYKPVFDQKEYDKVEKDLQKKVESKSMEFSYQNLDIYLNTPGLKMITKDFYKQVDKKKLFKEDPLPDGAKSYLQLLWLQDNGFNDLSLLESNIALMKGNMVEKQAIKLIGEVLNLNLKKNEVRKTKDNLSGECDIVYKIDGYKIVRDNKSPETWKSFRNKNSNIETTYFWQLVAYKYLYDADKTWLDYTLMNTPREIIEIIGKNMTEQELNKLFKTEEIISKLKPRQRIKSYKIDILDDDINFMVKRLEKAKEYYSHLDYDICMGIN